MFDHKTEYKHSDFTPYSKKRNEAVLTSVETKNSVFTMEAKQTGTPGLNLHIGMSNRRRYTFDEK